MTIYLATFGGFIALTSWLPIYWKFYFSVPVVTAGVYTALYSILTSLMRVAGGFVSDRLGGERTILVSLGGMFIGALMISFSGSIVLSLASLIVLAAGMGVSNAAVFKLVPQEVPKAVGGASGWVGGNWRIGRIYFAAPAGSDCRSPRAEWYAKGILLFVFLAALAFGLAVFLSRKRITEQKSMLLQPRNHWRSSMQDIQALLELSSSRHSHLCPQQVLGVRMALAGAALHGVRLPSLDKNLIIISETDGCFVMGWK